LRRTLSLATARHVAIRVAFGGKAGIGPEGRKGRF